MERVGRPPVEGKTRSVRIVLQALPEEAKAWKREAARRGISLSHLMRALLNAVAKRGAKK